MAAGLHHHAMTVEGAGTFSCAPTFGKNSIVKKTIAKIIYLEIGNKQFLYQRI
jgi:hypothetical protein